MRSISFNLQFYMPKSIVLIAFLLLPLLGWGQYPGGISGGLYLWLKGDVGVSVSGTNVSQWDNQAGTPMAAQASKSVTPYVTYNPNTFNYNPTVVFDGTPRQLLTGRFTTAPNYQPLLFVVAKNTASSNGDCCKDPYSLSPEGAPGIQFGGGTDTYFIDGAGFSVTPSPVALGIPAIVRAQYPTAGNISGSSLGFNGTVYNTSPAYFSFPTNAPSGYFQIGGRTYDSLVNRIYEGNISEVLHYNSTVVNNNQINQIESYLALKYGITLSTNYVNSSGQVVFVNDGTYNNNIIGIARDNNSTLLQKQTHQEDDTTRIYLSTLSTSNSVNTGSFTSDNQYLVIGNNNGILKSKSSNLFPPSLGIYNRLDREWKVTNTNFDGTFSLDIKLNTSPITASDLRILISNDGNFTNATMYNPSITYAGGIVTISNLTNALFPMNSTVYFTIVSLSVNTPLPTPLLNFNAKYDQNKATVNISFNIPSTSETQNDSFTIEKSRDGRNFEALNMIGKSLDDAALNYNYTEKNPFLGITYYRVKQAGNNGGIKYSNVVAVEVNPYQSISISPIPIIQNEALNINLIGFENQEIEFTISDIMGKQVYHEHLIIAANANQIQIDELNSLVPGAYTCTLSSDERLDNFRLIVK